jgi:geranylgeranyl diphosphate synthase, type II
MTARSSFDFQTWLQRAQARTETMLASVHSRLEAPPKIHQAMAYSLLAGGKRLRPILCETFAEACATVSRKPLDAKLVERSATALECIHTYSLIHDDLPSMDDDDLRRGKPTSHKVFGEAMAILSGDALLTEAFVLLSQNVADAATAVALVQTLSKASGASGMVGGQVLDIAEDRLDTEAYVLRLHALKTGALIRAACEMGVLCAGGDRAMLAAASTYGAQVGLAFQIADDVLDVTASSAAMGKPTGADAASGRFTFPAILGLEASKKRAQQCVAEAQRAIVPLEPTPGALHALASYAVERVA